MKFTLQHNELLKSLALVSGVVERRQTKPVLGNILFIISDNQLTLTGTDTEIEISSRLAINNLDAIDGKVTVPAKKLVDICRSLSDGSEILFAFANDKVDITSGNSRFVLSTLPADEFPNVEESNAVFSVSIQQKQLKKLIESTAFAMASEDVRYYLKGMLLEAGNGYIRSVTTDGHRLALSTQKVDLTNVDEPVQIIVPRKGIHELSRAAVGDESVMEICFGQNHLTAKTDNYSFVTKLIDGKYPDYRRVIPSAGQNVLIGSRVELKEAFQRSAVLLDEKFRGIRLKIADNQIELSSHNPDQEQAEDKVAVDYVGDAIEIGFNVSYLIDVTNALSGEKVKISLSDSNSSALLEDAQDDSSIYVVMPMRL